MGGPHMVRARRRNGETQPLAGLPARVVHGQLLPLDVEGEFFRPLADPGRRDLHAVGQEIPQPRPAKGNPLDPLQHRLGIPEGEVDPLGVGLGEDALLVALHGETDRHAGGNGIQRIPVAQLVPLGDGSQIVDAQERSQRAQRFVFRPAVASGRSHRGRRGSPPPVCSAPRRHSSPPRSSGSSRPSSRR